MTETGSAVAYRTAASAQDSGAILLWIDLLTRTDTLLFVLRLAVQPLMLAGSAPDFH